MAQITTIIKGIEGWQDIEDNLERIAAVQAILPDARSDSITRLWRRALAEYGVIKAKKPKPVAKPVMIDERVAFDQQIRGMKDSELKLKRLYKKALQDKELTDVMIDAYADYGQRWKPVSVPEYLMPEHARSEEVSISFLSDWHFWEVVDIQETGGLAEYNMDIAAGYLQSLVDDTISIFKQVHSAIPYRRHYVFMLGDFVSTNIHEVMQHSPGTAIDSLLEGQVLLGRYLMELAQVFDEVHVHGVVGNHGRLAQKKTYKKRYSNFDFALYNQLAMMLAAQPNLHFNFPRSFFDIVDIDGHMILLLHGDDIRSWNQIPWYGIDRALRNFAEILHAHGKDFEYSVMGHFHNTGALETCRGEKMINGSAIGTTDFSLGKLFTGNHPHQTIVSCHKKRGFTWRQPVKLEVPKKLRYKIDRSKQIHEEWRYILRNGIDIGGVDPLVNDDYK